MFNLTTSSLIPHNLLLMDLSDLRTQINSVDDGLLRLLSGRDTSPRGVGQRLGRLWRRS